MSRSMIRETRPADTDILVPMADGTGVFKPLEITTLRELLDGLHSGEDQFGHRAVTYELDGAPVGFAYFAPTAMTDRTWHLYWIFVSKTIQARGIGAQLMKYVEGEIALAGGRLLIVETSALPMYDLTRKFYLKYGYDQEATIRDFYADGDHQVIFRKHL
jgi:GNAT superfamily N-acetyltransferase